MIVIGALEIYTNLDDDDDVHILLSRRHIGVHVGFRLSAIKNSNVDF